MANTNFTSPVVLRCIVVTPEATVLDAPCEFVALPLFDGEAGIAPGRAPMIGRLGYGELRVRQGGKVSRYYVDGGFVQVANNMVSVLTNRAMSSESLDAAAAEERLKSVIASHAVGPAEMATREREVAQARGQLRVARR
ncbi:MAG: ATP synthase F1 subunit epsilon [Pirellulales bacterium]|nr:ATP synthase F1 subunit epsilon [Pirellulales bacterium]